MRKADTRAGIINHFVNEKISDGLRKKRRKKCGW